MREGEAEARRRRPEVRRDRIRALAAMLGRRLGLSAGEVIEILERLPYGEMNGDLPPEVWQRPQARQALERYAARKRAVIRLASRGQL